MQIALAGSCLAVAEFGLRLPEKVARQERRIAVFSVLGIAYLCKSK